MTEKDCSKKQDECFKKNIKPALDEINEKLDRVMPTVKEINNIRNAWKTAGVFGNCVVKAVIGIGVILTAIYAVKNFFKGE